MSCLTMPADAVGKKFNFTTKIVMMHPRDGTGLIQYTGVVISHDATTVTIREDQTNDTLTVALEAIHVIREESRVKSAGVVQLKRP